MLFALLEYEAAARIRFRASMEALLPVVEPALGLFEVREVESVPTTRMDVGAEEPLELAPVHAEQTIRFDPARVVRGDIGAVLETLTVAANDVAQARLAFMKANLDAMTEATGQVVRVSRDMNWDDITRSVAELPIKFDAEGKPTFVLWPPAAQARFDALGARTPEQEERWQALMTAKRGDARARERDRRLG